MTDELPWVRIARKDIGATESLGPNDSPLIRKIWAKFRGSWLLGQPWCGGAMAYWMEQCGITYPKAYYRAKDWLKWGRTVAYPCVGCVVVFSRKGGGHVAIVVGKDERGRLMCLGGNQGNKVCIAPFGTILVAGYRMPSEYIGENQALPLLASNGSGEVTQA